MYNLLEQSRLQDSLAGNMERWLQSQETTSPVPTSSPTVEDDDETTSTEILSKVLSNVFLFFLIFGLSATVDMKNLKRQLTNKFAIGCGVAMQFMIMPFLGFLAVIALREQGLTEAMGITLLVVTASPGGSYSNWWCSTFNGKSSGIRVVDIVVVF
jgi:ACR3 family arsenite efflux pump ArsB